MQTINFNFGRILNKIFKKMKKPEEENEQLTDEELKTKEEIESRIK